MSHSRTHHSTGSLVILPKRGTTKLNLARRPFDVKGLAPVPGSQATLGGRRPLRYRPQSDRASRVALVPGHAPARRVPQQSQG